MMAFAFVFGLILLLYGFLNWWIAQRGWSYLGRFVPGLPRWLFLTIYWLAVLAYPLGRLGEGRLPALIYRWLTAAGSYWMGFFYYAVLLLALLELGGWIGRKAGWLPREGLSERRALAFGGLVLALILGIVGYGAWNAKHPQVTSYEVRIPKEAGERKELRVVAVSDLHLGNLVHNGQLNRMVEEINKLQPDLILLPGDVIDEDPGPFAEQDMASVFRRLNPSLGIYGVPGNHEYYGGKTEEVFALLNGAGIKVLRDQAVPVDGLTLVGRDDSTVERYSGTPRKDLAEVMAGVNRSLPMLLLDHQPKNLAEAQSQGVDLQLSGHTHRGQLFPNNWITERIYELDYGYLKKGSFQAIVSSGFGTWGPPIRVGSPSEILDIRIRFGPE